MRSTCSAKQSDFRRYKRGCAKYPISKLAWEVGYFLCHGYGEVQRISHELRSNLCDKPLLRQIPLTLPQKPLKLISNTSKKEVYPYESFWIHRRKHWRRLCPSSQNRHLIRWIKAGGPRAASARDHGGHEAVIRVDAVFHYGIIMPNFEMSGENAIFVIK